MEIANFIVGALESLGVLAGVVFAIVEWREHKKIRNVEMLLRFSRDVENDPSIAEFFKKVDYGERWYDGEFHDSPFEKKVDYTLGILCHYVKMIDYNIIEEKDFYAFNYVIRRVLQNHDAQAYLFNLLNFTARIKSSFPFASLVEYGKSKGILDETFFNAELGVKKYGKTLNW